MRVGLLGVCAVGLLLFGAMGAQAGISRPLSKVAGVPVDVYGDVAGFNHALARYDYPGYPTSYALYERGPRGGRIHLSPFVSATLAQMLGGWHPGRDRRAAFAIFALAREMGHAAIGDPMHGQPGHDDPGATAWALKHYGKIARQLGVRRNIPALRRRAVQILRQWERGLPPSF